METTQFVLGVIGNVISLLVFACPIKTFWRIVRSKSTEDFDSAPYVITLFNSSLWVYYGVAKPGAYLVATVNGAGVFLEAIYVALFLIYADPTLRRRTAILVGFVDVCLLLVVIFLTLVIIDNETLRVMVVGAISACLNVFMYGSPLAAMKTVIRSKSVEYMPFWLSFFLFLNGGTWAIYAFLDKDIFLGIPNGIGFILGTIQLIIYVAYMNPKTSKHHLGDHHDQDVADKYLEWHRKLLIDQPNHSTVLLQEEEHHHHQQGHP